MRESGYHFVFSLENIDELKKLIDDMCQYQEESAYIEAEFYLPEQRKYREPHTGKYKYHKVPAQLFFALYRPEYDPEDGHWTLFFKRQLHFDETKADKRYKRYEDLGIVPVALPPFFDGKELPHQILEDFLAIGDSEISDD